MAEQPISVGAILVEREEFEHAANDETCDPDTRRRARMLAELLDELIEFRRKEASQAFPLQTFGSNNLEGK